MNSKNSGPIYSPKELLDFPGGSDSKESACNVGNLDSIPGLGRSPGERNGYPFQYSGLENSMNRGAWQATVHGVAKSQTWLNNFTWANSGKWWRTGKHDLLQSVGVTKSQTQLSNWTTREHNNIYYFVVFLVSTQYLDILKFNISGLLACLLVFRCSALLNPWLLVLNDHSYLITWLQY